MAQNLRNIRIAFTIQSLGIVAILGWEGVANGYRAVIANPLWLVFIATTIVFLLLTISISKENHES